MVIHGSSPSSSVICHLSFFSRHLGSPQWSSMVLRHRLLSSAIFLSSPVIWGRHNGHRWFFAIVFCHPPTFFLLPSSGVAAMVIDGSLPSSSVIRHLSFFSRHLGSPQWSSMVLRHRLLSSAIFRSTPTIFMSLSTASIHLVLGLHLFPAGYVSIAYKLVMMSPLLTFDLLTFRLQEVDVGFVVVIDRRRETWTSAKTLLLCISVSYSMLQ